MDFDNVVFWIYNIFHWIDILFFGIGIIFFGIRYFVWGFAFFIESELLSRFRFLVFRGSIFILLS